MSRGRKVGSAASLHQRTYNLRGIEPVGEVKDYDKVDKVDTRCCEGKGLRGLRESWRVVSGCNIDIRVRAERLYCTQHAEHERIE